MSKPPQKPRGRPFEPGTCANPKGRPKGSRNKLGEVFLSELCADFELHGKSVIETVRKEKPDQYLKVVASILPKELTIETNPFQDMTDHELVERFDQLRHDMEEQRAWVLGNLPDSPPDERLN